MNRRWIITGANGYLGRELSMGLSQKDETALAVARAGKLKDLRNRGIACYNYNNLTTAMQPGDIFVHCAGKTGSAGSWEDFFRINVKWTLELFDQAAEKGADCFVYISSVAAIGYRNRPKKTMLDEDAEPRLVSGELYGRSKLQAEQALQKRAREKNIRLIILRPGLIYGHRWFGRNQSWLRRGAIVDPNQRVPLVHIDNFLNALQLVASNIAASGIYFVVDDEQPTLKGLNKKKIEYGLMRYQPWRIGKIGFWILTAMRRVVRMFRGKSNSLPPDYNRAQFHFQTRRLLYSTKKLRSLVGWRPMVGLAEGLAECASQSTKNHSPMD